MSFTLDSLAASLQCFPKPARYVLAFSGGLDSSVLLHAMAALGQSRPDWPALIAVHVHHGLQAGADEWARHCQQAAARLGVDCLVRHVDARAARGVSPEAAARTARLGVFTDLLTPADCLLTAHHQDDQAETVMLQLLRGSGPAGLAAMPAETPCGRGRMQRPLLGFSRDELRAWAETARLTWMEDPSNSDPGYDRNYLRHEIMPRLAARWPALATLLARSAAHCSEAQAILRQVAADDLAGVVVPGTEALSVPVLLGLTRPRQANAVRGWIAGAGVMLPDHRHLGQILGGLVTAGSDRNPVVHWGTSEVRRYRDRLYLLTRLPPHDAAQAHPWDLRAPLDLPDSLGRLHSCQRIGQGLDTELLSAASLQVGYRRGGERLCPGGRSHRHSLKNLFQEAGVPPWLRDRIPLLWAGDQLAAVGDAWVDAAWQAAPGQRGTVIEWTVSLAGLPRAFGKGGRAAAC